MKITIMMQSFMLIPNMHFFLLIYIFSIFFFDFFDFFLDFFFDFTKSDANDDNNAFFHADSKYAIFFSYRFFFKFLSIFSRFFPIFEGDGR